MSHVAKADQNGLMFIDCVDSEYINTLIEALKKAILNGDKNTIKRCALELENYKTLCGSHPQLELLERQLCYTADKLGFASCPHIERAINAKPQPIERSAKRRTFLKPNWNVL